MRLDRCDDELACLDGLSPLRAQVARKDLSYCQIDYILYIAIFALQASSAGRLGSDLGTMHLIRGCM
jgi:hypothetical protein